MHLVWYSCIIKVRWGDSYLDVGGVLEVVALLQRYLILVVLQSVLVDNRVFQSRHLENDLQTNSDQQVFAYYLLMKRSLWNEGNSLIGF